MISKLEVPPLLKKFVEFYFYLSSKFLKFAGWGEAALMKAQSKCASGLRIRNSDLSVKIYAYLKMHLSGKVLFTRSVMQKGQKFFDFLSIVKSQKHNSLWSFSLWDLPFF